MEAAIVCGECREQWPLTCEQGVAIEWYGQCVTCRFNVEGPGTIGELEEIGIEAMKRQPKFDEPQPITQVADWLVQVEGIRKINMIMLGLLDDSLQGEHITPQQYMDILTQYDIDIYPEHLLLNFRNSDGDLSEVLESFYANEALKPKL
tara:strand:+ start:437 stop:883 length:447 start_codon:yes stop_codon:yes gene_type:complete